MKIIATERTENNEKKNIKLQLKQNAELERQKRPL